MSKIYLCNKRLTGDTREDSLDVFYRSKKQWNILSFFGEVPFARIVMREIATFARAGPFPLIGCVNSAPLLWQGTGITQSLEQKSADLVDEEVN